MTETIGWRLEWLAFAAFSKTTPSRALARVGDFLYWLAGEREAHEAGLRFGNHAEPDFQRWLRSQHLEPKEPGNKPKWFGWKPA